MNADDLLALRKRLGWTQKQCARYLGIHETTWIKWEVRRLGMRATSIAKVKAMMELSTSPEGRRKLAAWAIEDASKRAARRFGRNLLSGTE